MLKQQSHASLEHNNISKCELQWKREHAVEGKHDAAKGGHSDKYNCTQMPLCHII